MSHPAREIIDAVVLAVSNLPTTGGNVAEWRGYALAAEWDSWVVVQPDEESPSEDDSSHDTDAVYLALRVTVGSRSPSTRDQALLEVREAMARTPRFFEWTGTTFGEPEVAGDGPIFVASSAFRTLYQHDPSSPDAEQ